jgi:hypothetical protein
MRTEIALTASISPPVESEAEGVKQEELDLSFSSVWTSLGRLEHLLPVRLVLNVFAPISGLYALRRRRERRFS